MNPIIRLPSGKLINLSCFIALLPDKKITQTKYKLSLAGLERSIEIDSIDAEFISSLLQLEPQKNNSHKPDKWDKEAQLRQNQPLMKLIKQMRVN
jgi:hypothetical protein